MHSRLTPTPTPASCRSDERGSVALTFGVALIAVVLAGGSAIDYGRALMVRTELQAAMDIGVLAGAGDGTNQWSTKAESTFLGQLDSASSTTVARNFTKATDGTVTGTASTPVDLYFGGLFGLDSVNVAVTAKAKSTQVASRVCVLLLSTASQPLLVNSGANVTAPECEIHVRSTATPGAIFNASTNLTTKRICIAAASVIDNGGTHPNVQKSCAAVTDPFAGTLPAPASTTCTYNGGNWSGGTITLSPGVYCGWYNLNNAPTVNFSPGVYVIKGGGVNVNGGTWNGTGVTFYFDDTSTIQFNSAVTANLSAPTSGAWSGILFYEKAGLSNSNFVFNDSAGHNLDGLMWLPSRNVTFNSGAHLNADKLTMVFNTLILNTMSWNFGPATKSIASTGGTSGSSGGSAYLVQ